MHGELQQKQLKLKVRSLILYFPSVSDIPAIAGFKVFYCRKIGSKEIKSCLIVSWLRSYW